MTLTNLTKGYVTKKASVFTPKDLHNLLDDQGLLDDNKPEDLEMMVGTICGLYGMLRCNEIIQITCEDVMTDFYATETEGGAFDIVYNHQSKTKKDGFSFRIPGKYRFFFCKIHLAD